MVFCKQGRIMSKTDEKLLYNSVCDKFSTSWLYYKTHHQIKTESWQNCSLTCSQQRVDGRECLLFGRVKHDFTRCNPCQTAELRCSKIYLPYQFGHSDSIPDPDFNSLDFLFIKRHTIIIQGKKLCNTLCPHLDIGNHSCSLFESSLKKIEVPQEIQDKMKAHKLQVIRFIYKRCKNCIIEANKND